MAKETPNSYKDPFWSDLATATETKLDLPKGLLVSIINSGERSNNDQVSEAGAKSPFQIIPATRKAAIDKFGIDPYLSSDNAAEVAGLLLKDSLDRNKGNVLQAIAEYHGGTDRGNWGPRTKAYVSRVAAGMRDASAQPVGAIPAVGAASEAGSTFDRVMAAQPKPSSTIAAIYDAYRTGKMSPEDASEFEKDVNSGLVMLPKGAKLNTALEAAKGPTVLPEGVATAYNNGTMDATAKAELDADIKSGLVTLPKVGAALIPGQTIRAPEVAAEPGLVQQALGVGEAGLNAVTGATGGALGMAGGATGGLAASVMDGSFGTPQALKNVEQGAAEGAAALTYQPRTTTGQNIVENVVAPAMQAALPIAGVAHTLPPASPGAAVSAIAAKAQPAIDAVKALPAKAAEIVKNVGTESTAKPTAGSAGAAAVPTDTVRAAKAANLPVPIELTKGAESRSAAQLAFEKEQMKGPLGEPLRNRIEENNLQALQNFDVLKDKTGANAPDVANSGAPVIKALSQGYEAAKNETRVAYKKANDSPEAQIKVDPSQEVTINKGGEYERTDSLIGYFNSVVDNLKTTDVTDAAKAAAIKLGIVKKAGESDSIANKTVDYTKDANIQTSAKEALDRLKKNNSNFDEFTGKESIDDNSTPNAFRAQAAIDVAKKEGWDVISGDAAGYGNVDASHYLTLRKSLGKDPNNPSYDPGSATVRVRIANHDNTTKTGHFDKPDVNIAGSEGYVTDLPDYLKTTFKDQYKEEYGLDLPEKAPVKPGQYVALEPTVKQMQELRQEVNNAAGFDPRDLRQASIINKLIDSTIEPVAGPLYKQANATRRNQATKYENRAIVARLVNNVKGKDDPKVYAEQVFQKSILNAQPEEITFLKRVLNTTGEDGKQAWKEMQGAMLDHIKSEATKGMGMDSADRPIISPAKLNQTIQALDKNGRLDLVLGKTEGGIVRDLNDVVKYVNTVPPGTLINNSGTVGTLLAAIAEAGTTGALTGLPVPLVSILRTLTKHIQNNKVKAKIEDALNKKPVSEKF